MLTGVHLEIKRSRRRKTASLQIGSDSKVVVSVPLRFSDARVQALLDEKRKWILRKLQDLKAMGPRERERQFVSGEMLPYQGLHYRLVILKTPVRGVSLSEGNLIVLIPPDLAPTIERVRVRTALLKWYQAQALEFFQKRARYFSELLGVEPKTLGIRTYKSRWGTCDSAGNIKLNWRLILAPSWVSDYVIVHELCHLRVMSHAPRFWKFVASVYPDYKKAKRELRMLDHRGTLVI